ncbi:MAG: ATP-binding cassette domain-containing protein, partial [Rhodoferax sp.]
GATGADLLLVYWALKLPALGHALMSLAQQVPAQRNVLLRLMEPLSAPLETLAAPPATAPAARTATPAAAPSPGLTIGLQGARVLAGGHAILDDVDLQIRAGEHVAVVGTSGAGKSTLFGVLLGWHHLAAGSLQIDGEPLAPGGLQALRRQTAWVDPGIQLWNRSLMDNLHYACEAPQHADTAPVLDAADLRRVLQRLPEGLQSWLGESGALLSGGEGQRVRLARALLQRDARLVLLDEPFRGLDRGQRSALLQQALRWWHDRTLLCVTHDVAETRAFARVLVVEDGHIVEDGAPQALAAGDTRYRALLDAEARVREQLWQAADWRRVTIAPARAGAAGATVPDPETA